MTPEQTLLEALRRNKAQAAAAALSPAAGAAFVAGEQAQDAFGEQGRRVAQSDALAVAAGNVAGTALSADPYPDLSGRQGRMERAGVVLGDDGRLKIDPELARQHLASQQQTIPGGGISAGRGGVPLSGVVPEQAMLGDDVGQYDDPYLSHIETLRLQGRIPDRRAALIARAYQALPENQRRLMGHQQRAGELAHQGLQMEGRQAIQSTEQQAGELEQAAAVTNEMLSEERRTIDAERMRQQAHRQAQQQLISRMGAASRDLASTEIRGDRRTDTEKMRAAIVLALTQMGSALTGTSNDAAALIMGELDRDVEAQKANANKKATVLGALQNEFAVYRQHMEDDTEAEQALRARKYQVAGLKLRHIAETSQSERTQMRATQMAEQLEHAAAQLTLNLENDAAVRHQRQLQARLAAMAKPREAGWSKGKGEFGTSNFISTPYGSGFVRSEKVAEDMDKALAITDELRGYVQRLQQLQAESTGAELTPAKRAEAQFLTRRTQLAMKEQFNLGALDKGSITFMEEMAKNPVRLFQLDSQEAAQLQALERSIDHGLRTKVNSTGMVPAQRRLTPEGPEYRFSPGRSEQGQPTGSGGLIDYTPIGR